MYSTLYNFNIRKLTGLIQLRSESCSIVFFFLFYAIISLVIWMLLAPGRSVALQANPNKFIRPLCRNWITSPHMLRASLALCPGDAVSLWLQWRYTAFGIHKQVFQVNVYTFLFTLHHIGIKIFIFQLQL